MPEFNRFKFSKLWTNPEDFPTYESDETKVREDMQLLFDELKAGLNGLMEALEQSFLGMKAASIPFDPTAAVAKDNVQAAIELLATQMSNITLGQIPDASLTAVKLADAIITASKIAKAAVGTEAVADAAITAQKLAEDVKELFAAQDEYGKVAAEQASARIVSVGSSRTLAESDAGCILRCTNNAAITLNIPAGVFPTGTEIEVYRAGAGAVNIEGSGVIIECAASNYSIMDRYSRVHLKKWEDGIWSIEGNVG